jgi:hypothetical protein
LTNAAHSFGAPVPEPYVWLERENLDGEENPLAVFSFKYHDRKSLQSLLILPRTPSPDPEATYPGDNTLRLDNLDANQKKKLELFLKDLKVCSAPLFLGFTAALIPCEQGNDNGSNTPSAPSQIKLELDANKNGESSRKKKRSDEKITMIDLTGSNEENRKKKRSGEKIRTIDLTGSDEENQ